MKQIFLVLKREYMVRVKKRSFLLATILTPLIFPALIFGIYYLANRDTDEIQDVFVLDESGLYENKLTNDDYNFTYLTGNKEEAQQKFQDDGAYGLLYIPSIDLTDASKTRYDEFEFYSKTNLGINVEQSFERQLRKVLEDIKLDQSGLDPDVLNSL